MAISAIALFTVLASGPISSRASSPTANYILKASQDSRRQLQNSLYLGLGSSVFEELADIYEKTRAIGWDGDSAEPVSHDTYFNAWRFLESIPLGFPAPSVGVESDGHLTLEWYKAPRRTVSVSVSPDGFLYFAALIGLQKANGCEPLFGEISPEILELVGKVYAK